MLGLEASATRSSVHGAGNGTQGFVHASRAPHQYLLRRSSFWLMLHCQVCLWMGQLRSSSEVPDSRGHARSCGLAMRKMTVGISTPGEEMKGDTLAWQQVGHLGSAEDTRQHSTRGLGLEGDCLGRNRTGQTDLKQ